MPSKPNLVNQLLYAEYKKRFTGLENLISVGYAGMTVEGINQLRNKLADLGLRLLFVKNRIANIAIKDLGHPEIKAIMFQQSALILTADPVALTRALLDFQKERKELKIHGAMVEDTIITADGIDSLSKAKSKAEMKAMLAGQILGPGSKLSAAILGPGQLVAGAVKRRIEMLEKPEQSESA